LKPFDLELVGDNDSEGFNTNKHFSLYCSFRPITEHGSRFFSGHYIDLFIIIIITTITIINLLPCPLRGAPLPTE
jgi:hypothetical protein